MDKIDGRTKEGRKIRAATVKIPEVDSPPLAPEMPNVVKETRPRDGATVVRGRNGEILTRAQPDDGLDEFRVPGHLKEDGWDYQWNTLTIYNSNELTSGMVLQNANNGWRPVLAQGKWNGVFAAPSHKGAIIKKGCVLEERPAQLSYEARSQELRKANQLVTDRNESLKLTAVQKSMQGGFAMNSAKYRGTGGDVRISVDQALDVPRPSVPVAGEKG